MKQLSRLIAYSRKEGFRKMCRAVYDTGSQWIFSIRRITMFSFDITDAKKKSIRSDITTRKALPEDMSRLKDIVPEHKLTLFKKRLMNNRICFMAFHGNDVAGYIWSTLTPVKRFDEVNMKLDNREAFQYNSFVLPKFRRKGVFSLLKHEMWNHLREDGVTKMRRLIDNGNKASIASAIKDNGKVVDEITVRTILGRRTWQVKNGHEYGL